MEPRICRVCGESFEPKQVRSTICSARCTSRAYRNRDAECVEAGCGKPQRARGLCSTHYNRAYCPGSQKIWPAKPETRRAALHRKNVKRRIATRGAAEVFDYREIFERDRWRCGICHGRVNRALTYPHPRSASLDHIVPLSQDANGHTRANVRLAHLDCNVRRSNRGGAEQLFLIG